MYHLNIVHHDIRQDELNYPQLLLLIFFHYYFQQEPYHTSVKILEK